MAASVPYWEAIVVVSARMGMVMVNFAQLLGYYHIRPPDNDFGIHVNTAMFCESSIVRLFHCPSCFAPSVPGGHTWEGKRKTRRNVRFCKVMDGDCQHLQYLSDVSDVSAQCNSTQNLKNPGCECNKDQPSVCS